MKPFTYIGCLPKGDWRFCLIVIEGKPDVIVVADFTGQSAPRVIIDGELHEITP